MIVDRHHKWKEPTGWEGSPPLLKAVLGQNAGKEPMLSGPGRILDCRIEYRRSTLGGSSGRTVPCKFSEGLEEGAVTEHLDDGRICLVEHDIQGAPLKDDMESEIKEGRAMMNNVGFVPWQQNDLRRRLSRETDDLPGPSWVGGQGLAVSAKERMFQCARGTGRHQGKFAPVSVEVNGDLDMKRKMR